jgi:hypothetical protein
MHLKNGARMGQTALAFQEKADVEMGHHFIAISDPVSCISRR